MLKQIQVKNIMTMTLQQISDRLELQDLVTRYSHIIDQGDYDDLIDIFTRDAWIDYTAMGGVKGNLEDVVSFLKKVMPGFSNTQHMVSNYMFDISGDEATGRVMCFNPMERSVEGEEKPVFFLGFWYVDEYCRTSSGWRIKKRIEEKSYHFTP